MQMFTQIDQHCTCRQGEVTSKVESWTLIDFSPSHWLDTQVSRGESRRKGEGSSDSWAAAPRSLDSYRWGVCDVLDCEVSGSTDKRLNNIANGRVDFVLSVREILLKTCFPYIGKYIEGLIVFLFYVLLDLRETVNKTRWWYQDLPLGDVRQVHAPAAPAVRHGHVRLYTAAMATQAGNGGNGCLLTRRMRFHFCMLVQYVHRNSTVYIITGWRLSSRS